MRMRKLRLALAILSAAALTLGSGGSRGTSERYAFSTFREQADRATLLVDGYLAALHADDRYIPVSVAVGLDGPGPSITVSPESFTLLDADGRVYATVSYAELLRNYPKRQLDASAARSWPIVVGNQFAASIEIPASFYPTTSGRATRFDRVELPPFTWFRTMLYFPRPETGLRGVLTLRLAGGGIGTPVEVRFEVPQLFDRKAS